MLVLSCVSDVKEKIDWSVLGMCGIQVFKIRMWLIRPELKLDCVKAALLLCMLIICMKLCNLPISGLPEAELDIQETRTPHAGILHCGLNA